VGERLVKAQTERSSWVIRLAKLRNSGGENLRKGTGEINHIPGKNPHWCATLTLREGRSAISWEERDQATQ